MSGFFDFKYNKKGGDGDKTNVFYHGALIPGVTDAWRNQEYHAYNERADAKKRAAAEAAKNSPQAIQARIAREQWDDFKTRYVPIENKFMELVRRDEGDKSAARASSNADVSREFGAASHQMNVQKILAGDSVGTAGNTISDIDAMIARGEATGAGSNAATRSVEDLDLAGRQKAVALGRGIASSADLGLKTAAVLGSEDAAGRAKLAATRSADNIGAFGTVAGAFGSAIRENRIDEKRRLARSPVKPATTVATT